MTTDYYSPTEDDLTKAKEEMDEAKHILDYMRMKSQDYSRGLGALRTAEGDAIHQAEEAARIRLHAAQLRHKMVRDAYEKPLIEARKRELFDEARKQAPR